MPSLNSIAVAAGAFLVGIGSALSGVAAWKMARKRNEEKDADGR